MKRAVVVFLLAAAAVSHRQVSSAAPAAPASPASPTIEEFLKPGTPTEVVAAKKAERIAWTAYEHGLRNVYTASAPAFTPVRLTNVTTDDGVELSDISIADDGGVVVFVRGTAPNRDGWVANPTANPAGAERTIWAARTAGGGAWKLGAGTTPALSPDGRTVAYAKDGQIYSYAIGADGVGKTGGARTAGGAGGAGTAGTAGRAGAPGATRAPLVKAWGT